MYTLYIYIYKYIYTVSDKQPWFERCKTMDLAWVLLWLNYEGGQQPVAVARNDRNLKVRDTQDPYHPNRKMFVDIPGILIGHRFWHNYRNLCSCMGKLVFIEDRVYGLDQSMMKVVPPTISAIIIITHNHCPSHTNINNNHNPQYIWVNLELSMVYICLYNH